MPEVTAGMKLYDILRQLAPSAGSYLEVGVQEGGSLRAVVTTNPSIHVVLSDDWGTKSGGTGRKNHDHVAKMLREIGHVGTATFVDGQSQTALRAWLAAHPDRRFDLTLVDGDHPEPSALADLQLCWPVTSRWLVLHDVWMQGPWKALRTFSNALDPGVRVQWACHGWGTGVLSR